MRQTHPGDFLMGSLVCRHRSILDMCNRNTADLHDYPVSPHLIPGCIGYPTKIRGRTRIQSVLNVIRFGHAMSPTRSISCHARTQAAGYPRKVGIVSDEALNPTPPARVATLNRSGLAPECECLADG